jgi:acetoin utilization protein AcuB
MTISYKGFMRERIQRHSVTISPDASLLEARQLIHEKGNRHLVVVDRNRDVVGIVTERDLTEAAPPDSTRKINVSAFMTPKERLIWITPDTMIEEAVQLLHDHKIRCLPVLEEGRLYGIFTETDALSHLVDLFGLKQKGTRLTLALEDKPGALFGILKVIKDHELNVISVVSPSFFVEGKRIAAIRIETEKYEAVVKDLEKTGYPVLSVGKWPSL